MLVLKFRVLGVSYAIAVRRVVEVVPRVELRTLPHAPNHLVGLLHYRGGAVPIVDLGLLMGSEPCRDRLGTRIILVEGQATEGRSARLFGLVAEHVDDVEALDEARQAVSGVGLSDAPYLGAVYETDLGLLQILEPSAVPVSRSLSIGNAAGGLEE